MNKYAAILVSAIVWPTLSAISLILLVVGLFVVGILAALKQYQYRYSQQWQDREMLQWTPNWAWLWGNEEDGIDGMRTIGSAQEAWWVSKTVGYSKFRRIFTWSVLRNSVGNARFVYPFGFIIDPSKVQYIGNSLNPDVNYAVAPGNFWYFAWHGLFTGFWIIYRGWQFRIGYKILPSDRSGLTEGDYRKKGCGFAFQLQKK